MDDRPGQGVQKIAAGRVLVEGREGLDDRGTGDFACGVPTHPVGHGDEPRAGVGRVLVPFADVADVGSDGVAQSNGHRRSSRMVLPMRTGIPIGTGVGEVTRVRSR